MSNPNTPFNTSNGPSYAALPPVHTHGHGFDDIPRSPRSPASRGPSTPQQETSQLPYSDADPAPYGAAHPRFLGPAMYEDQGGPQPRNSFAPSQRSLHTLNDANSSVYALNRDSRDQARPYGGYNGSEFFAGSDQALPLSNVGQPPRYMQEKRATYAPPREKSRRKWMWFGVLGLLILVALGVALGFILRPKSNKSGGSGASGNSSDSSPDGPTRPQALITGGDGSKVTFEDGTSYTYRNPFGGYWHWDENDPFNNGARAQSWSPALNETFKYGIDKIRGYVRPRMSSLPFADLMTFDQCQSRWLVDAGACESHWVCSKISPNLSSRCSS
jgi:glucan 1,3-beta-glucosidase